MRSVVIGCVLAFALALGFTPAAGAGSPPHRAAPSRPATRAGAPRPPPIALHVGPVDYVKLTDVASWLHFRATRSHGNDRVVLTNRSNPRNRVEFEADSRRAVVDGLSIYLGNPIVVRRGQAYVGEVDLWHCLLPLLQPAVLKPPPHPTVIALDAGHGGLDNGMENVHLGLREKVLTLDVVNRVKRLLEADGYRVVLTRKNDGTLSSDKKKDLAMRTDLANRAGAQLFLSVHFNSLYPDTKTGGTEVYVYTPAHQRSSAGLGIGQVDDSKPMQPVNRYDPWSSLFAHEIHRSVLKELRTPDRGQKTMHLAVLQDLNCPAALIESVFLSNDAEARLAATPGYRQRIAESLSAAIREYVGILDAVHRRTDSAVSKPHHRSRSSS